VNKVVEFVGGRAAVDKVQSLRRVMSTAIKTPDGAMMNMNMTMFTRYGQPAQRVVMTTPMGEVVRVVTADGAFVSTAMGVQDLPSSQRDAGLGELRTELLSILQNSGNPKFTFTAAGTEKVNGVDAQVLEINADGSALKWYVEPSGRLLRTVSRASGPMPGEQMTDWADWKSFGGINLPTKAKMTRNGETVAEAEMSEAEVNPTLDANAFVKPQK
jgi:hypothetical protein